MFSQACVKNSVHKGGGVSASVDTGIHTPQADTPWAANVCWDTQPPKQTPPGRPPLPRRSLQRTVRILLECIVVLKVVDEENIQQKAHDLGTHMLLELAKIRDEIEIVGDVRGKGLMIGVEMVTDKVTITLSNIFDRNAFYLGLTAKLNLSFIVTQIGPRLNKYDPYTCKRY